MYNALCTLHIAQTLISKQMQKYITRDSLGKLFPSGIPLRLGYIF